MSVETQGNGGTRWPHLVRANGDKPHRCPSCHRIPDSCRRRGRASRWRTHHCFVCNVRWWRGWDDC